MRKFELITLIFCLTLTIGVAVAQQPTLPTTLAILDTIPADLKGTFTQTATSGAIIDNRDGTHVLMFKGDIPTLWEVTTPTNMTGEMDTVWLTRGWRGLSEQRGEAIIGHGTISSDEGLQITLSLTTPLVNAESGQMTYRAVVETVTDANGQPISNMLMLRLTNPILTIDIDANFLTTIQEGLTVALDRARDCECPPSTSGLFCEICRSGG